MALFEERECTSYDVPVGEGAFKTRNLTPGQVQRVTVTDRGLDSYFKATARIITCVHGHLETIQNVPSKPATLLVLEYRLHPKPGHSFSDVYTSFTFRGAESTVIAYAPFQRPHYFDKTPSKIVENRGVHGTIGGGLGPATVEGGGEATTEETRIQQHFAKGTADTHYCEETGLDDTVWWRLEDNRSQKHGVLEVFRVAVLIQRQSLADFVGTFRMDIHGSFSYLASQVGGQVVRFFRRLPVDDPVNFSPTKMPLQGKVDGLEAHSLGALMQDMGDGAGLYLPPSYHVHDFLPN
jgi:hypothetical protein